MNKGVKTLRPSLDLSSSSHDRVTDPTSRNFGELLNGRRKFDKIVSNIKIDK